jgi:putative flippase GtrA
MTAVLANLLERGRSPEGRKIFRYVASSIVSYIVSLACLTITKGVLDWSAFWATIVSTAVATVPSYELNRKWAWGKSGKSHLWKEVVPFWALAFVGLAFATFMTVQAEHLAKSHHLTHLGDTVVVEGGYMLAYAILWVGKFMFFNKVLFAHHPEDLPPALDGRTGVPG